MQSYHNKVLCISWIGSKLLSSVSWVRFINWLFVRSLDCCRSISYSGSMKHFEPNFSCMRCALQIKSDWLGLALQVNVIYWLSSCNTHHWTCQSYKIVVVCMEQNFRHVSVRLWRNRPPSAPLPPTTQEMVPDVLKIKWLGKRGNIKPTISFLFKECILDQNGFEAAIWKKI